MHFGRSSGLDLASGFGDLGFLGSSIWYLGLWLKMYYFAIFLGLGLVIWFPPERRNEKAT